MNKLRQAGFTAIEGILALIIVAALVGVGFWVMSRESNEDEKTNTSQSTDTEDTVDAPAVNNTSDLDAAEKALDDSNLDAGDSDNQDLDQELKDF